MRITLTVDGRVRIAEVDLAAGTVTVEGVSHAVKVVQSTGERAELEIDGEPVAIEGWPEGLAQPLKELSVNGERVAAHLDARGAPDAVPRASIAPAAPGAPEPRTSAAPAGVAAGTVVPPMPGKIIEVRVRDGERVRAGQVLLVLEAMKMRNDVVAPSDGTVHDVRVAPGANVRAREAMLRIVPD